VKIAISTLKRLSDCGGKILHVEGLLDKIHPTPPHTLNQQFIDMPDRFPYAYTHKNNALTSATH
jgi:hypothetical protein